MKTNAEIALAIRLSERMDFAFDADDGPEEQARKLAAPFKILLEGINAAHPLPDTNGHSATQ